MVKKTIPSAKSYWSWHLHLLSGLKRTCREVLSFFTTWSWKFWLRNIIIYRCLGWTHQVWYSFPVLRQTIWTISRPSTLFCGRRARNSPYLVFHLSIWRTDLSRSVSMNVTLCCHLSRFYCTYFCQINSFIFISNWLSFWRRLLWACAISHQL